MSSYIYIYLLIYLLIWFIFTIYIMEKQKLFYDSTIFWGNG